MPGVYGHWARDRNVAARTVEGETLLVPIRHRPSDKVSVISLNGSGSLLWQALEQPTTAAELVTRLTAEYDVTSDAAQADVVQFLAALQGAGLIVQGS
jgi:Coenzyme PQQ synthesis protein D (PqqD)